MQQPRIGNFNHFVHDSINTFCEGYARMSGAIGATREALIAAFCRLDKSLSCCWQKGWLVGAVGIEPTTFGLKGRCSTTELRP